MDYRDLDYQRQEVQLPPPSRCSQALLAILDFLYMTGIRFKRTLLAADSESPLGNNLVGKYRTKKQKL